MSTQLISRPAVAVPSTFGADVTAPQVTGRAPARQAPFWLTDQQLSVQERNRALARYTRSSQSLLAM